MSYTLRKREPIVLLSVAALVLLATAARAQEFWKPRTTKGPAPLRGSEEVLWSVAVQGSFKDNEDEARDDALDKAHAQLLAYLQRQSPPVQWTPGIDFVKKLVRDESVTGLEGDVGKEFADRVGPRPMKRVRLRLVLGVREHEEILRRDREFRVEQRQVFLLKVLGAIMGLLALVAMYVRLEDWTKGYYTAMLRLAAASGAAAILAAAGAWLFHLL